MAYCHTDLDKYPSNRISDTDAYVSVTEKIVEVPTRHMIFQVQAACLRKPKRFHALTCLSCISV
jgi:hypothetical protein